MTRIWSVPFGELDDKRVLGQHRELHMIYGSISKGHAWKGWERPEVRDHLLRLHDDIVQEMRERSFISGFLHDTAPPSALRTPRLTLTQSTHSVYESQASSDRWDLLCRWQGIYKGRVPMPDEYLPLLEQYNQQGGCLHNGQIATLKDGRILCLICKQATQANKDAEWQQGVWIER